MHVLIGRFEVETLVKLRGWIFLLFNVISARISLMQRPDMLITRYLGDFSRWLVIRQPTDSDLDQLSLLWRFTTFLQTAPPRPWR